MYTTQSLDQEWWIWEIYDTGRNGEISNGANPIDQKALKSDIRLDRVRLFCNPDITQYGNKERHW